jgi:type II secretory pathway pseudopilin PulG
MNKSNKGFSIIELLVYMGIFIALLTVTLQMFSSIFDLQVESEATSAVAGDSKYIMNRFTYDLNRADSVVIPSAQGSTDDELEIVVGGQTLNYSLINGNLILENETQSTTDQINSSETSVSNVSFLRLNGGDNNDVVQMTFTLTSKAIRRSGEQVVTYKTSAGLR